MFLGNCSAIHETGVVCERHGRHFGQHENKEIGLKWPPLDQLTPDMEGLNLVLLSKM